MGQHITSHFSLGGRVGHTYIHFPFKSQNSKQHNHHSTFLIEGLCNLFLFSQFTNSSHCSVSKHILSIFHLNTLSFTIFIMLLSLPLPATTHLAPWHQVWKRNYTTGPQPFGTENQSAEVNYISPPVPNQMTYWLPQTKAWGPLYIHHPSIIFSNALHNMGNSTAH